MVMLRLSSKQKKRPLPGNSLFLHFAFQIFRNINYRFFLNRHHQNDLRLRYALPRQNHQRR